MRLINEKTGLEVKKGDKVETFRGETVTLDSFDDSRVYCYDKQGRLNEWFHSVISCRAVD